ncbi:unnamed protein product [Zymoseptoria tritici ST99CH_1A5]|uniref:Uncharacterized protein n=1 Tax=Zymoseptoria tritici ST99CH_1A5 TaxID=1276529 RepID=A0A1Y6LL45_ZYMTR|nr:unnamed protein product [Zymoseptoria tritici ST99CH_1A5]
MAPTNAQKIQQAGRAGDQSRLPAFDRRNTGSNTFLTATYALARRTAPEVVHPTPKEMSEQTLAGLTMSSLRELVEKNEDDVKGNPAVAKRILSELNNTDEGVMMAVEASNQRLRAVLNASESKEMGILRERALSAEQRLLDANSTHEKYVQEAMQREKKLGQDLAERDGKLQTQAEDIVRLEGELRAEKQKVADRGQALDPNLTLSGAVQGVSGLATSLWGAVQNGGTKIKSVIENAVDERQRFKQVEDELRALLAAKEEELAAKEEELAKVMVKNEKRRELLRAALPLIEEIRAREVGPLPLR